MSCLFSAVRIRWATWQRERRASALARMDATIDAEEENVQRRMAIHEEQADVCRSNMQEQLQRFARDPVRNKDAKLKYVRFQRDLTTKHEFEIAQCNTMIRNFADMRNLIDKQRNSAEHHSVVLSKLVTQMEQMHTNPAQLAAETAKRNARTAMQITRQREVAAESDTGVHVINTAFEEECEAVMEPEASTTTVTATPFSAEIEALFAEARNQFMDESMHSMPLAPTRDLHIVPIGSPLSPTSKTVQGEVYQRL